MSSAPSSRLDDAITLLDDARSSRRRSAAKQLRRMMDPAACEALARALRREVAAPRTWETQYHLVMALGTCGCRDALPLLETLATTTISATMVYTALGDAIVRLSRSREDDPEPALRLMRSRTSNLVDGAFRAVAMLRLRLPEAAIRDILDFVEHTAPEDGLRFWVAAAAAGWRGARVEAFLRSCLHSPRSDVRAAAEASLRGDYGAWRIL